MKFSYKLALTISLSALFTFIILDVSLIVMYQFILKQHTITSGYNIQAFNQFSSEQIINSAENYINSGFDVYEQVITQLYTCYTAFKDNPQIYTSLQSQLTNPKLTQTYQTPTYNQSSIYMYSNQSTFYNQPYFDRSLSFATSLKHPSHTKRVNIIYQSLTNPQDIMVRTVPGTDDFTVPSVESVSSRFINQTNNLQITNWYYDNFSKSNPQNKLMAIRTQIANLTGYRMLIEIQIELELISQQLNQVYSYTTTALSMIYLDSDGSSYSVLGQSQKMVNYNGLVSFAEYLQPGIYNFTNFNLSEHQLLISTVNLANKQLLIAPDSGQNLTFRNLRLIMILNKTQTNLANAAYYQYQNAQYNSLLQFLFLWSCAVIVLMIGIGYTIADYLFSYFSYIKKKCRQYIKNPQTAESAYFQMKQKASQQNHNRIILQNMISIIQRIQSKKKMNQKSAIDPTKKIKQNRKYRKMESGEKDKNFDKNKEEKQKNVYDQYPLNFLSSDFQEEMYLKDWERFQAIGSQLQAKIAVAAAAAAAAKKQQSSA